ncbi:MAG TPA: N-acetylmuramoyl-L-alanine amidase [Bryobacteraceae bacterium]|nr:N-acetylmuramoyl-L-alanine amidase [Bryobacteraceae bacterium]
MSDRFKVVIDPGHGGTTEVGGSSPNNATGPAPRSLKEKDLTLRVASLVEQRLRSDCDVFLTRSGDTNLSLADRAAVARTCHADVFLSIHFNAFSDTSVNGTEVWVANGASTRSRSFAQETLNRLVLATGVANRGVRERNLGVLLTSRHDPHTAACLAEISFLTNPREAARLEDATYLGQIADVLAAAVRAQAPVAVSHAAAGAGGGFGRGYSTGLADPDYDEPAHVNDQRYSAAMSDDDLERLYALPLDVTIRTVTNADARIRSGPPGFAMQGQSKIPRGTRVQVEETQGAYSRVKGVDGTAYGWTASSNLREFLKDDPALATAALVPSTLITIEPAWPELKKAVARTYNRLGGLMQTLATRTRIDLAGVLATWYVESGGRSHTVNHAIIRFENHLLFNSWGKSHTADFDLHFQFGTRPPATGSGCQHAWQCHKFRVGTTGDFESTHQNQDSEYRALACANALAGEDTGLQCISIGGSQILISNYANIGCASPRDMYDSFQASERAHVLGFFDYCNQSNGTLLTALRESRWADFASGYNGSGRATQYGTDIQNAAAAATAVLGTRPAGAQSLDFSLGDQSVDIRYPVHLIPQPDKRSCWAASMAMLVSYYRQASLTPESLAAEVSRSLRTSYDWSMLRAVRQHFLFKEVALPSNLSFVPPPSDWFHWLEQFGPLWITVQGNPSHAVVVAGIHGDLTPGGTYIRVLNPWDDRVRFDRDEVDFHPVNQGHEETYTFANFSSMFGNMDLANYGDWRVLYLGRRPEHSLGQAEELDVVNLSPEEIADAEPARAHATAADATTLSRPALGESDARWADDNKSIDYRHLGAGGVSGAFAFTPALLNRLCELNRFDVTKGQDEVLFGLRGCEVVGPVPAGFVATVQLSETMPDHKNARCILGVWKRSTAQFRVFTASTVPNWALMERFRQGGDRANLLPTGCYLYKVGSHRPGTRAEVPGAFLEAAEVVILRTLDDLEYTISDTWDSGDVGDNIHPARLDQGARSPFFSSAGCQTVPGNVRNGSHTGTWAQLRAAAGLSASSPASENGRRFVYALFTGRDARLLSQGTPANSLIRLRFGSTGVDVTAIQLQLRTLGRLTGGANGVFDVPTKLAYIAWQRARSAATADGVVTPSDAASLGADIVTGRSVAVTHSLEDAEVYELGAHRAPTDDEVVTQLDLQEGTHYGTYAGYKAALVNGTVFGFGVSQITPSFLRKLQAAEAAARTAIGGSSPSFGIVSCNGYRASEGMHNWGLAVDINYYGLPYIMHSNGEAALDRELGPVYERIARLMLRRASVIPRDITQGARSASRTSTLYDRLFEESNAMIQYFQLMQDTTRLGNAIHGMPADTDWQPISGAMSAPTSDAMQNQMMADYVTLAGRNGPTITGKNYPAVHNVQRSNHSRADRPFESGDPHKRGPELGFMSIRKEVVMALSNQGLRWGAIDFGGESGDVMHFDDRLGEGAKIARAKSAATAAIATSSGLQTAALTCADVPVDEHAALVFSAEAPLAARSDCDARAVWTYVPDPPPSPPSVLVYFHGNNASVVVDAQHPEGRLPSWNRVRDPELYRLRQNGPFTPGVKYDIAGAALGSRQRPMVLIPEIGNPRNQGSQAQWANTDAGVFKTDPAALSRMIDDVWGHLARLHKPSGAQYVPGGSVCPALRRAFLAGHSGGGVALGPSAMSSVGKGVPTDLWLMDCTYNFGVEQNYVDFCRHWKAQGKLGNDSQSSRMVMIAWTASQATTTIADGLIQQLRAGWRDSTGQQRPGFNAVKFTRGMFCPWAGNCPTSGITPPAGTEIVEVMADASWPQIDSLLRQFPVVYIHTAVTHDEIPLRYFPHLLSTAAG